MGKRFQVIKRTDTGVYRHRTSSPAQLDAVIAVAQSDPNTLWIVVKDLVLDRSLRVWRRDRGQVIPPWWRDA